MTERVLYDAYGNPVFFHYDDTEDRVTLHRTQDCEPILERNKVLANLNDGYSPSRELKRIASIPTGLISQWLQEDGVSEPHFWLWHRHEQNAYLRRRYSDSDYQHVRTA